MPWERLFTAAEKLDGVLPDQHFRHLTLGARQIALGGDNFEDNGTIWHPLHISKFLYDKGPVERVGLALKHILQTVGNRKQANDEVKNPPKTFIAH